MKLKGKIVSHKLIDAGQNVSAVQVGIELEGQVGSRHSRAYLLVEPDKGAEQFPLGEVVAFDISVPQTRLALQH